MSDEKSETARQAYHLKRASEEIRRAEGAVEPGARLAHHALAKLHQDQVGNDSAPGLLIVRE